MLFNTLALFPRFVFLDVVWLFSQKVSGRRRLPTFLLPRQKLLHGIRSKWPARH